MTTPCLSSPPRESSPRSRRLPTIWLEIARGRTRYPRRPVLTDRFLIGAGSNCHLQLGGDGIPFLHSLLAIDPSAVSIEAFVPWPELTVNGQPLRTAVLGDGDEIGIGPFRFTIHLQASVETGAPDPLYAPLPLELAQQSEDQPLEDLAAVSTTELVERIESLQQQVDDDDAARRAGAAALLAAVRHSAAVETAPIAVLHDITAISHDLERRISLLREREQEQTQRAESLLLAQARLAEQLELASRSLAGEQDRVRASA